MVNLHTKLENLHIRLEIGFLAGLTALSGLIYSPRLPHLEAKGVNRELGLINASTVLIASNNPNFEKPELSALTSPVYKPTFYPIWWDGYEQLRKICSCESWGTPELEPRQFNKNGTLLRGYPVPTDVGACQISTYYWGKKAKELGLDIEGNFFDNIKMAKWLFDRQGSVPWAASARCWKKNYE